MSQSIFGRKATDWTHALRLRNHWIKNKRKNKIWIVPQGAYFSSYYIRAGLYQVVIVSRSRRCSVSSSTINRTMIRTHKRSIVSHAYTRLSSPPARDKQKTSFHTNMQTFTESKIRKINHFLPFIEETAAAAPATVREQQQPHHSEKRKKIHQEYTCVILR